MQNAKMLFPAMNSRGAGGGGGGGDSSPTLFDASIFEVTRGSNFRGNAPEFRIARSDATDNGRRKYYTSPFSNLNFPLSAVSAVY